MTDEDIQDPAKKPKPRYAEIIEKIFLDHHKPGMTEFEFTRDEFERTAKAGGITVPKNLGDIPYSFRYRKSLPEAICATALPEHEWIIWGHGHGRYKFVHIKSAPIVPDPKLPFIDIPDATPEIIAHFAQSDEQALLARIRYNRLIDIFLEVAAFSLQNHMRTSVVGIGQIEIDEIYIGIGKDGRQFIVPVQAKTGSDHHGVVQTLQDKACCNEKFRTLVPRLVSAQLMAPNEIVMFELEVEGYDVKIVHETHYRLVRLGP